MEDQEKKGGILFKVRLIMMAEINTTGGGFDFSFRSNIFYCGINLYQSEAVVAWQNGQSKVAEILYFLAHGHQSHLCVTND